MSEVVGSKSKLRFRLGRPEKKTFRPKSKIVGPRSKQRFRLGLPQKHNVDRGRNAADTLYGAPAAQREALDLGLTFLAAKWDFRRATVALQHVLRT